MYRFTLFNDINGLSPWKQCIAKKIKTWSDISIYAFSQVVIDGVTYYKFHASFQGLQVEAGGGIENYMLYPAENVHGTRDTDFVTKYGADGDVGLSIEFNSSSTLDRVGVGYFAYHNQSIINSQVVLSGSATTALRVYTLNYNGVDFVVFGGRISNDPIYELIGVSKNAFAPSTTPRFVPITEPDPEGGFPTGSTPSGDQDGTVINVNNGGDTVNVAPPNVSVGVEINMPEPDLPKRALPGSGITIAKVDNAALGALSSALWGRNPQGFDDLWLMFQNYNCNPIAGIVSCVKLPMWVMSKVVATTSKQPIIIAGTSIENFEGYSVGEQTIVEESFYTGPITQFNSYKDFVGVSVKAYAPFIGWFDLDPNLCFGVSTSPSLCSIRFHYKCDVTTGNLGLTIWANTVGKSDTETHNIPIATGTGNCAYNVLLAGNDRGMGDTINAFKQGMTGLVMSAGSAAMGSPLMAMGAITSGVGMISSILGMQEHTAMVGSHAGNVGYLTYDIPMVIITKPRYVEPPNYSDIYGHPSFSGIGEGETGQAFIKDFLGGYGEFDVHADNIGFANASEQKKIIDLLANGVYV